MFWLPWGPSLAVLSGSRSCIIFMPLKEDESCLDLMTWCLKADSDFLRAGSGQGLLVCPEGCVPPGGDTKAPAELQWMTCQQQVTPGPFLRLS